MEIKTLEGVPLPVIAKAFNKAFSDYSIPISYSDENFNNKILSEGINLKYSPAAFIDGEIAGFILHGLDEIKGQLRVFNAGTGVMPQHRGKFIIGKLYDYILPVLAAQGYCHHQLEVLEGNDKAERIYAGKGFIRTRKLLAFKGMVNSFTDNAIIVSEVPLLDWAEAELYWNVQPTWQNYTQSILRAPALHKILKAEVNGVFAGYAVAERTSGRLKQFAVNPEFRRRGVGRTLFSHAANENGLVSFINFEDTDTGSIAFFKAIGLSQVVALYEMAMQYND